MKLEPGQSLLHYRLVEKVGEGGMGVVVLSTFCAERNPANNSDLRQKDALFQSGSQRAQFEIFGEFWSDGEPTCGGATIKWESPSDIESERSLGTSGDVHTHRAS